MNNIKSSHGTVEERFVKYCKVFVKSYEIKISEFEKEAAVGGKAKIGKTTDTILSAANPVGLGVGLLMRAATETVPKSAGKGIGDGIGKTANFFCGKRHRCKAKNVIKHISLIEKAEFKRILLYAAGEVFAAYEAQLCKVLDADGSWMRAMEKSAIEAMDRSINYLHKLVENNLDNTDIDICPDFIAQSIILGDSKKGLSACLVSPLNLDKIPNVPSQIERYFPKPGHTLHYDSCEWKISDMYKGVGVVQLSASGEVERYYIRRYFDKSKTYGYRLLFSWENWNSFKGCIRPSEDYKYLLSHDMIQELLSKTLENLTKNDTNFSCENIYETKILAEEIKEEVRSMANLHSEKLVKALSLSEKISTQVNINQRELLRTAQNSEAALAKINEANAISEATNQQLQNLQNLSTDISNQVSNIEDNMINKLLRSNDIITDTNNTVSRIADIIESDLFISCSKNDLEPILFDVMPPTLSYTGRDDVLDKLHSSLTGDGVSMISQMTVITGLGGVGKSELARKYISVYKENYNDTVIWIKAQTNEQLSEKFRELARDVLFKHVIDKDLRIKSLSIKSIVNDIYKKLSSRKCLIVFDNAEKLRSQNSDDANFDEYLPQTAEFIGKIFVIITSRFQKCAQIDTIPLNVFTSAESAEFIRKVLHIDNDVENNCIIELSETLQHLPLALQQATIYIKEMRKIYENIGRNFSIEEYLSKYKVEKEQMLDYNFFEQTMDVYKETVFTTWRITMQALKMNELYGKLSTEILELISYISPDDIFASIFTKSMSSDVELQNFAAALELLKQFSMINTGTKSDRFKVHRLVQDVTRINLKIDRRVQVTIDKMFNLLHDYFSSTNNGAISLDELFDGDVISSHLQVFLQHIEESIHNCQIQQKYIYKLLLWIGDKFCFFHQFENNEKLLKLIDRILTMPLYYDAEDIWILSDLSNAFSQYSKNPNKRKLLERCCKLMKHFEREYTCEMAEILKQIANTFDTNDPEREKIMHRVLNIYEKEFGENSVELLPILESMSILYENNHLYVDKQIKLFERILKITIDRYGEKHYDVYLVLKRLNTVYASIFNYEKQVNLLNRMLEIQELYPDYIIETLVNLSDVYKNLGQKDKQLEVLNRALDIKKKEYGTNHRKVFHIELLIRKCSWSNTS